MSVTTANPVGSPKEAAYKALTAKWSERSLIASQAVHDLWELECELDELDKRMGDRNGLSPILCDHLDRIGGFSADSILADLNMAEQEEDPAYFLEDGSAPPPPVSFVDENEAVSEDKVLNRVNANLNSGRIGDGAHKS